MWFTPQAAADLITSDVDAWGPSPGNDLKINLITNCQQLLTNLDGLFMAEIAI